MPDVPPSFPGNCSSPLWSLKSPVQAPSVHSLSHLHKPVSGNGDSTHFLFPWLLEKIITRWLIETPLTSHWILPKEEDSIHLHPWRLVLKNFFHTLSLIHPQMSAISLLESLLGTHCSPSRRRNNMRLKIMCEQYWVYRMFISIFIRNLKKLLTSKFIY